jgi:hypothetical protein
VLARFGCGGDITELVIGFVHTYGGGTNPRSTLRTLQTIRERCPDPHLLTSVIGRLFWMTGQLDSADHYTRRALREGPRDARVLRNALALASAREDFERASTLAQRLHEATGDVRDLEQAAICAYPADTARAYDLYKRSRGLPGHVDSASAARWFFEEALAKPLSQPRTSFFAGSLFHLNFALFAVDHRRNRDRAAYHLHKARAFYAHALRELPPAAREVSDGVRPFGSNTLLYFLDRKEYSLFDRYLETNVSSTTDSATLNLLRGYRYFDEALDSRRQCFQRVFGRTGGIPRKYPVEIVEPFSRMVDRSRTAYDPQMLHKAFEAMERARAVAPNRRDIYLGLCRMAAEAGRTDRLVREVRLLVERFGCSHDVAELAASYAAGPASAADPRGAVALLGMVAEAYPDSAKLKAELGRLFGALGEIDSAYRYVREASRGEPDDSRILRNAVTLATVRGDFAAACSLALKRHDITADLSDLEQAAVCAFPYDTVLAHELYTRARTTPAYTAEDSPARWFFEEALTTSPAQAPKRFFTDSLFHLNFALFEADYRRNQDRISYYMHKASAFYAYGVHDSAAYYNLNLLRNVPSGDLTLGYTALFNLAAEYYASGKHRLSYDRFLNLYKRGNGRRDVAVRYALAVNYEEFGDIGRARSHYRYVVNHPDDHYERYYDLQELAAHRLRALRSGKRMELVR